MFCEKGVLQNFAKFTRKHLLQSLFFNKVAGLRPAALLKNRLRQRCFLVNFAKFLSTYFFRDYRGGCFCRLEAKKFTTLQRLSYHCFLASGINTFKGIAQSKKSQICSRVYCKLSVLKILECYQQVSNQRLHSQHRH